MFGRVVLSRRVLRGARARARSTPLDGARVDVGSRIRAPRRFVVNARPVEPPTAAEWDANAVPARLHAVRVSGARAAVADGPRARRVATVPARSDPPPPGSSARASQPSGAAAAGSR